MPTWEDFLTDESSIPVSKLTGNPSFDSMSVDTISEKTSGSGVTIDGVLLKDGAVTPMGGAPCAKAYHDADQSIANATWTSLAFNSERFDTDTIHDPSTNNTRLTCKTAGKYIVTGQVDWASNATGVRALRIRKNGSSIRALERRPAVSGARTNMHIATLIDLAANDYLELQVYQNSGGALNAQTQSDYAPEFMMVRVA